MRVNVSADSSSATIDGLEKSLSYFVQVLASMSAGDGVVSSPQVIQSLRGIGIIIIQQVRKMINVMQVEVMA